MSPGTSSENTDKRTSDARQRPTKASASGSARKASPVAKTGKIAAPDRKPSSAPATRRSVGPKNGRVEKSSSKSSGGCRALDLL